MISGTVWDQTAAVLPGVSVTVINVETGIRQTVFTNGNGAYYVPNLALGNYEVRAELPGFQVEVRGGITLTVRRHAVVDFRLRIGAITEQVSVVGEVPLVDTSRAAVGDSLSITRLTVAAAGAQLH